MEKNKFRIKRPRFSPAYTADERTQTNADGGLILPNGRQFIGSDYEPPTASPVWTNLDQFGKSKNLPKTHASSVWTTDQGRRYLQGSRSYANFWTIPEPPKSENLPASTRCTGCGEMFELQASYLKHMRSCGTKSYTKPKSVVGTQNPSSSTSKPFGLS